MPTYIIGFMAIINIYILSVRGRLYKSESDAYTRQILTSTDGPRAERVRPQSKTMD